MSIKKNYIYNLTYQVLTMILPLVTIPYVSRVLSPEGVGTYSYTNSIVQFFILFSMLGISTYGNKMVAITRDNKKLVSKTFLSIYFLQVFFSLVSLLGYMIFVINYFSKDRNIALLQIISLISATIDCSWLFNGLEQFKKIIYRNTLIKIISLIAVFLFVKKMDDLGIYTIIMGLSTFIGQLVMWVYVKDYIVYVPLKIDSIIKHFKPTIIYFLPQLAGQVYFVLNKTMIGILSSNSEVGIYDYADRILKISLTVVTSLGIVMLPRMSNTFANGEFEKAKDNIIRSLEFSTLLAIPIMFGLAGISKELIPWYMGKEFSECIVVLEIISPTILLMSWSGVFGTQYLIPLGKMKEYNLSLYVGAIVNLIANIFLIKLYRAPGAAIGTLFTEIVVAFVQFLFIRNDIDLFKIIPKLIYNFISGIIMFIFIRLIGEIKGPSIFTTFIQVLFGSILYFMIIILIETFLKDGLILKEIKKVGKNGLAKIKFK